MCVGSWQEQVFLHGKACVDNNSVYPHCSVPRSDGTDAYETFTLILEINCIFRCLILRVDLAP